MVVVMKKQLLFLVLFLPSILLGQLLPSIGIGALPADTDSICTITPYLGAFAASGFHPGDTVPDFTLYDVNGDSVNLATELQAGLPVLLISSSYTCPVFRNKIPDINLVDSVYQGQVKVLIVYTPEAHPIVDLSPYSGTLWTTSQNQTQGVLFEQSKTYGERKAIIDSMQQAIYIRSQILIDGPCNEWWLNYGPAPNNATLIQPNGVVFAKHDWFHKAPLNIFCDIDSLLGTTSGHCNQFGNNGNFSFTLDADSMESGRAGDVLAIHGTLTNHSSSDNVILDIAKLNINIPAGWETALCADICYPTSTAQTQITLVPNQVQPFTFYFYTDSIPAVGDVLVGFRNNITQSNNDRQGFYGSTLTTALEDESLHADVKVYPNPFGDRFRIVASELITQVEVYDVQGKLRLKEVFEGNAKEVMMQPDLPAGLYFLRIGGGQSVKLIKK